MIRNTASHAPGFGRSIPLNRDDESRIEAIERELIKLGSNVSISTITVLCISCTGMLFVCSPQTNMDIVRYSLVHWEQLIEEPPSIMPSSADVSASESS